MNDGTLQLPPQASTVAPQIDALYYFIFWGCTAFFVLIVGLCLFFMIRYRRREGEKLKPSEYHNTPLEVSWTIIPLILVMVVFVWGFKGFMVLHIAPGNSIVYQVTGKKWLWEVKAPNGSVSINEMVVPVNQPVKILLKSDDILHSFFVPAFRVKQDAVPNRYNTLWFEATQVGEFDIFCTEYCGSGHSGMLGKVKVVTKEEFEAGFGGDVRTAGETPFDYGKRLYESKACITCHSLDGSKKTGPSWKGVFGSQEQLVDGTTVTVDENYIRQSILEPTSQVVAGFEPVMPVFAGILSDEMIEALTEFIKEQK